MKKKIRLVALHVLVSFFLVSILVGTIIFFCYPSPYFEMAGANSLIVTLFFVDVCLGPLITFVIYNPQKKRMKLELTLVAALQLLALSYGVQTFFVGRPVFLVFDTGRFSIVSAYQIPDSVLAKVNYPALSLTGPQLVGARVPSNTEERKKYVNSVLTIDHVDLPKLLQYHVPYKSMELEVGKSMLAIDILLNRQFPKRLHAAKKIVNEQLNLLGLQEKEVGFVPLLNQETNWTVLVRNSDKSVAAIINVDPIGSCVSEKNSCVKMY